MENAINKPIVRPGHLDDLVFAATERVLDRVAHPVVNVIFHDVEPLTRAVLGKYLGKIKVPGAPKRRVSKQSKEERDVR
jgi:hypothetical protein